METNNYSYSRLQTYERCPELYKKLYIEKKVRPAYVSSSVGKSFHKTTLNEYDKIIKKQDILNKKDYIDITVSEYETEIRRASETVGLFEDEDKNKAKDDVVKITDAYYPKLETPEIEPIKTEEPFSFILKFDNKNISVKGSIDLRTKEEIIDLKVVKRTPDKLPIFQTSLYSLARVAKQISQIFVVRLKQPKIVVLKEELSDKNKEYTIEKITAITKAIENGIFYKKEPASPASPCNGCWFIQECWGIKNGNR